MHTHPNARLTPAGRERLVRRHIDDGMPLAELAAQTGISLRSAYKWLARYRSGGAASLVDRRSVRRTPPVSGKMSPCNPKRLCAGTNGPSPAT
jgi:transposase